MQHDVYQNPFLHYIIKKKFHISHKRSFGTKKNLIIFFNNNSHGLQRMYQPGEDHKYLLYVLFSIHKGYTKLT